MRIIFTGAQGTGKTTIIDSLDDSIKRIRGITRNVVTSGNFKFNEGATDESQKAIFDAKKEALEQDGDFISERSLIDVLSYTYYNYQNGRCSNKLFLEQYHTTHEFIKNHPDDIYMYFPVEFELVDDGIRSVDKKYQEEVDSYIRTFMNQFNVKYIKMTGTVENRLKILKKTIKKFQNPS